jgi:hypothetical protein
MADGGWLRGGYRVIFLLRYVQAFIGGLQDSEHFGGDFGEALALSRE